MNILELSEQELLRREAMKQLRQMGVEPYPAAEFPTNAFSADIKRNYKKVYKNSQATVSVAGRVMGKRIMGGSAFLELQDSKGRIQVYVNKKDFYFYINSKMRSYKSTAEHNYYNDIVKRLLDIGDFIGVKGKVFVTKTGEISIHASSLRFLSKSLKPLPIVKYKDGVAFDKFDDPEQRYRQRYVDLVVNEGVKDTFLQRATVIRTIRKVLDEAGYTEVETPDRKSVV